MIVLEEKLYTSEETADILGINTRTLYRYLKKGDIESETKTKSGTFRFTRNQIYRYLYPDKYEKIISLLQKKEHSKYAYLDNSLLNKTVEPDKPDTQVEFNNTSEPHNGQVKIENNRPTNQSDISNVIKPEPTSYNPPKPTTFNSTDSQNQNADLGNSINNGSFSKDINNLGESASTTNPAQQTPRPAVAMAPGPSAQGVSFGPSQNSGMTQNLDKSSHVSDAEVERLKKERASRNLDDELKSLQNSIQNEPKAKDNSGMSINQQDTDWKYYVNQEKDILQLAKEVNSLASETGRKYAATMKGGLSLHHDIDEFNQVHFYVDADDLNWWVSHLELSYATQADANICLIPCKNLKIFENSYKLRGLQVVADEVLIQDLMRHGEKDLAKTLL